MSDSNRFQNFLIQYAFLDLVATSDNVSMCPSDTNVYTSWQSALGILQNHTEKAASTLRKGESSCIELSEGRMVLSVSSFLSKGIEFYLYVFMYV